MSKYTKTTLTKYAAYIYKNPPKSKPLQPYGLFSQSCIKPFNKKKLLSELLFYNSSIRKPIVNLFTDRKLSSELPFCKSFLQDPIITKYPSSLKIYKHSCKVEVLDSRIPAIQLFATKPPEKYLLKGLSAKMRGLKFRKPCMYVFL